MDETAVDLRPSGSEQPGENADLSEEPMAGEQQPSPMQKMVEPKTEPEVENTAKDPVEAVGNPQVISTETNDKISDGGGGSLDETEKVEPSVASDPPAPAGTGLSEVEGAEVLASLEETLPPPAPPEETDTTITNTDTNITNTESQDKPQEDTPPPIADSSVKSEPSQKEPILESVDEGASNLCNTHCSKIMYKIISQRQFGRFCDVLIRTSDRQIWAHKCVLSANSPYFDSFLLKNCNTQEDDRGQGEVQEFNFNDFSPDIIETMINYMYSGKLGLQIEQAEQFLLVADKFLMTETKLKCSQMFSSMVTSENWFSFYQLANKHGLSELSLAVSKFLIDNIEKTVEDPVFLKMDSKQLLSVFKRKLSNTSEDSELRIFKGFCHWISHDFHQRQNDINQCLETIQQKELHKSETYRYIESDLASLKNQEVLSDSTLVSWLIALNDEDRNAEEEDMGEGEEEEDEVEEEEEIEENPKDDPDYDNFGVSDETAGESDDELFVPGKELRNVMTTRKTRSSNSPRKRKSSHPQRSEHQEVGFEVTPIVSPPVKRGRGRPRKTDPKPVKPAPKPKGRRGRPPGRKNKVKEAVKQEADIKEEVMDPDDPEVKRETDSPTTRATRTPTAKSKSKCPECSETFTSQSAFRLHMKEHGVTKPFKCNLCSFQTIHYGIFTSHKRRQHRVDIQCPKCPREFPSQSALNHHMRGHGSDTPFLCDVCGFTTKHFASMNIHKRRHNGKMLKCTYEGCTYESTRSVRLRDHMNMHLGVKNYICPVCGKAFGSRKHLSRHENIHKTEKALNCKKLKCPHEGCTYEAVRHTRLRDHMNMHLGLKNYICTVCGKAFGARKHLFRHENIHKTEKTLNCEQCTYTTSRRDRIRQHIKRHHPHTAVVLGYITEHEAAVQINKNLNNIKPPPVPGVKKSHKKKKKTKEEEEGEKAAEGVMNLEAASTRDMVMPPLPPAPPQATPVPHHIIAPILHAVSEPQGDATKTELKQTVSVTPSTASTIVDMIHYFMAPDGTSSEPHQAWNYHSNPL